jgi:hypothetical protein
MIVTVTGAVIVGGERHPVQTQVTIPDPEPAAEEEGRA